MQITLSKPITYGDDSIAVLDLRDPTVTDVAEIGYPFLVLPGDGDAAIELRPKVIIRYAARLSGLPPSVIKDISLADLNQLQAEIMGFFGDAAAIPQSLPIAPSK